MLYWLLDIFRAAINRSSVLGPLGVLEYVEFRALAAVLLSFTLVLAFGKRTIRTLVRMKVGDSAEFHRADLNELMRDKRNVPTMGGVLIVGSIVVTTLLLGRLDNFYVTMALVCVLALAAIGFADDYLKLTTARRKPGSRDGLRAWEKLLFQVALAVILAIFCAHWGATKIQGLDPAVGDMSRVLNLPGVKTWEFDAETRQAVPANILVLGTPVFVILTTLFIVGSSNAVNLTDGMDGLASGITVMVAGVLAILCIIAGFRSELFGIEPAKYLLVPHIPLADELAVIAAAVAGACLAFLWFNGPPAQVFMGDTGSLALGGLLGFLAVVIRQEVLLLIIGGVFVFELMSVVIQVGYFKLSGGKRVFKCAPVHHHFHLSGWTEHQVVVRAWIVTAMLSALALTTIKLR
ncbi:MAG: phospho-N-acetylmuramoyl-pentapeptide-transferase [Planctomycetota bacterium]